ncbi:MAG: insulinase family protein [Planctomycetes bacterium]|nr:insulinase family protein [Planctomycetota bacterium]
MKLTRYREFQSFAPQPGVRLLGFESDRFKTIRARVYLLTPIEPHVATENSLLARVLRAGTESLPTRRELARACEELYGATLGIGVSRFADTQALVATVDFPGDRFLPKGSKELEGALSLLVELLTKPALSDNGSALRADIVEQEKYQLENDLRAMQDDKGSWAGLQATQRTYAGTPGAIFEQGEVRDLKTISAEDLLNRHRSLIGNARVLAFVTGPVQPVHALTEFANRLTLPRQRRAALPPAMKLKNRKQVMRNREKAETEQTHLVFTWAGGGVYGTPGYAPMLFADALLGGYGMSRLFKVVREEHGLAYSVYSQYHRARGSIVAQAAVDPARADQAVKLIRSEFKRLVDKGFSSEEFASVRESLIESRRSAWDSQGSRVSDLAFQTVLGFKRSPDQQLRDIRNVEPKEVRAALKKLKAHSEFRLG